MGNLKHTAAAIAAVVMISSLAVAQTEDLKRSYNISSLLSSATSDSIVFEETASETEEAEVYSMPVVSEEEAQAELSEQYTQEELDKIYEQKSHTTEAYVILTSGVLSVRELPSADSSVIDTLEKKTTIEILESTEDWFKIRYADGKTGYVTKANITADKEAAETAAKYFDNYRYGKVKTNGGTIRIRKGPSTSTDILGELEDDSKVILIANEGDFVKVCYSEDYLDGYIVASAIEVTDSWFPKSELSVKKQEVAERKAREKAEREAKEKAEREAKEKAAKEAAAKKAKSSSSSQANIPATGASASSKGQAIVNSAKKYLGVRYVYGGSSPSGFDCSGLVQYVFRQNGISVSRTSAAQSRQGKTVSKSELQPGDLLFFAKNGRVHHVGIYAGGGQMIHAPHTGDVVRYSSINTAYRQREFYCAKRFY